MKNYSFIIPHHNSPDLLNRCLDSIPQRNDIEIIVVDDNSDVDKRPDVMRSDVKLIYIDSEHTKGAGRARNYGLNVANGKWLLFADCDDFYEKGFIDELDKYKNSDYDIIFFDAYFFYNVASKTYKKNRYEEIIQEFLKHPSSLYWMKMLKHGNNATWMRMYSHQYITKIGVKYDEIPACNDGWFVQYAGSMSDNVAAIPLKLYYYVENSGSIIHSRYTKKEELLIQQSRIKVHHLMAQNYAFCAIPPFFHGIRRLLRHYGLLFSFYLILRKLIYDVSPFKLYYYKYFYSYDKK